MSRPTREQIERALGVATFSEIPSTLSYLAAEVRALRSELFETHAHLRTALDAGEAAELRIVQLRAEVAQLHGNLRADHAALLAAELRIVELRGIIARAIQIGEKAQGVEEDLYSTAILDVLRGKP